MTRHFLTGTEWSPDKINLILDLGLELYNERKAARIHKNFKNRNDLTGQTLVMLFDKPSLRTRMSFTVAMTELGGHVIDSQGGSRKTEEPEDLARVLSGYAHGVMIRTFDHNYVERFSKASMIPVINGLTDSHHPCQVMADLLTLKQKWKNLNGLKMTYIGDGNNMLHSLMLLCPRMGIHLHYACPKNYQPDPQVLELALENLKSSLSPAKGSSRAIGSITSHENIKTAVSESHALYTDVWTSMGFEAESIDREVAFRDYQVDETLLKIADPEAIVLHCMPMERGKEISKTLPDHPQSFIFMQSENRLHIQKAILLELLK